MTKPQQTKYKYNTSFKSILYINAMASICDKVRNSCRSWMTTKGHQYVKIHHEPLREVAVRIRQQAKILWDEEDWHYQPPEAWPQSIRQERIALYILALDAINFCFWPSKDSYEYVDIACTLTAMASHDHDTLDPLVSQTSKMEQASSSSFLLSPSNLRNLSESDMTNLFTKFHSASKCPPDMDRRCALWNELGNVLCTDFDGSATRLIQSANGSAVELVQQIYDSFPGFRDWDEQHHLYFLKRAQICVGDLQAALKSQELTKDMHQLTTFADYRLPQLLRHWGVFEYIDSKLAEAVDACEELPVGSDQELSIRAATVDAVEQLVALLSDKKGDRELAEDGQIWTSVQVDWYLWQVGERMDGENLLKPHHRVRTIFY